MGKIINIIITSIALLLAGYYAGVSFGNKQPKKAKEAKTESLALNNTENKNNEVIGNQDIVQTKVTFDVKVIIASLDKNDIDPELKDIKKTFDSVTKFTEFKLLKNELFDVIVGEQSKILLPDNQFLYFIPKNTENDFLSLNMRIPWVLNINLHVKNNEGFFHGGLQYQNKFIILYIKPSF